jgi:HK97 family phage portal protein
MSKVLNDIRARLAEVIRPRSAAAAVSVLPLWWESYGGAVMDTAAGIEVSPLSAYHQCTPVYGCIKVIAESIAPLPLHLYSDDQGARERELDHPVANVLERAANEYMTAFDFRLKMMENALLWGNAYAAITRDRQGCVRELWPIPSEMMAVELNLDTLAPVYRYTDAGNHQHVLGARDILHIKTLGHRYYLGSSPIMMNRGAIALAIAMEQHASRIFGRAARPAGVLKTQKVLSPEAIAQLRMQLDSTHGGKNSAQSLVLEEGMDWQQMSMDSVSSQFFELRKWQLSEVARIFRIPLILLQDYEKTSQNNTETLGRQFVSMTLQPWLTNWEQAISLSLLSPDESRQYYPRFDLSDFTRADTLSRYQAWVAGVTNGLLSPNEVRSWENLPPYEGGDEFHRPLNTGKAAGTPATQGQLSHIVSPTETMTPALTLQSRRAELENFLARHPSRLRLTAPPRAATRPRADPSVETVES